jgi:predicted CxxxxCH...CXXCH cytochrome family protein
MKSKINTSFIFIIVSYLILMFCSSCKDENNNNFTSNIVFPDTGTISFTRYVQPLFQQTCVASQCHGGSSPADGLDLTAPCWGTLVGDFTPVLVVPKKSGSSLLYTRIAGLSGYTRMPPSNYPALTTNQVNGVKKWIDQGAANN